MVSHFLLQLDAKIWRLRTVGVLVFALGAAGVFLSMYNDGHLTVLVYRFIGPLATVSLELLLLITTFAALAVMSQRSGFPALTLIVLTMVICVIFPNYAKWTAIALGLAYFSFAIVAFVSGRIVAGAVLLLLILVGAINFSEFNAGSPVLQNQPSGKASPAPVPESDVQTAYLCWLDQKGISGDANCGVSRVPARRHGRSIRLPSNGKYAVFIVAAEGGGIYAASAAATFLANLEDIESGFAQHIFAISGVSGGSIGAAIFQALDHARHPDPGAAATATAADGAAKVQDDHVPGNEEACTQQSGDRVGENLAAKVAEHHAGRSFFPGRRIDLS